MTSEEIRAARAELGESQAEFARRFGVNQSTVHRWETRGISDTITRLAIESVLSRIQCSSGANT